MGRNKSGDGIHGGGEKGELFTGFEPISLCWAKLFTVIHTSAKKSLQPPVFF
jgi:hypothetical protein